MHWIIQDDLYPEAGLSELRVVLSRLDIPHSFHRVPPGEGRLEPEIAPSGRVFVIGGYSLSRIAQERGWAPGSLPVPGFLSWGTWSDHLLNFPAWEVWADELKGSHIGGPQLPFFCRPMEDSKKFTGRVFYSYEELQEFVRGRGHVHLLLSNLRGIYRETRVWIVGQEPVAWSTYKEGGVAYFHPGISDDVLEFARARASEWNPAAAYVMDIAETPNGLKIVEINNINAAGLYAANIGKLVMALEEGL